jgi:leucyl aminopeptidase
MRLTLILSAAAIALSASPALAQSERVAAGSGVIPAANNSTERPIRFDSAVPASGVLAIPMASATDLARVPAPLVEAVQGAVAAADFKGKADATLNLYGVGGYKRVLLVGTGEGELSAVALADLGGRVAQSTRTDAAPVAILTEGLVTTVDNPAAHIARGFGLGQWRFDQLKTVDRTDPATEAVTVVAPPGAAQAYAKEHAGMVDAMRLARDLISLPSNLKHPESFVSLARAAFEGVPNTRITVLDEAEMRRLGMGSILSVSQGSVRPARIMIVDYRGAGTAAPVALVGKGITFDTGGISIKPSAGMQAMRADMSGAAGAIGAALAAARRGAKVNVVAVAALAENMPGANASRPGDVVRTMNGRTIEIISTDAEGRMVLADANQYVVDRYQPAALVNLATLTGAVTTALGDDYAGLFARDDALASRIETAAKTSGDPVWRLPLHPSYADDMKSPVADIANSTSAPGAGAGRGAHFIGFMTPEPTPWAHIDMAGVD